METVADYFSRVAEYSWWETAIELFFIGLVVYGAIDFLEDTRGERLFRGMIFILAVGFLILNLIVQRFGFERLEYLYRGFLIAVLVVAVVAFQPEIRRALMHIGQPRFLKGTTQHRAKVIEEIISAVSALSASRVGAIIVLENRVALGEFIETGVRLDSKITSELLKTIFWPGTALHDMAVIIRGDRILAARVQLPLAEAGSIEGGEMGSRHRAGIGITAGSDATCIIVSEETGAISVAQGSKMLRNINESGLRAHLTTTMIGGEDVKARFWRVARKNTGQKPKG